MTAGTIGPDRRWTRGRPSPELTRDSARPGRIRLSDPPPLLSGPGHGHSPPGRADLNFGLFGSSSQLGHRPGPGRRAGPVVGA